MAGLSADGRRVDLHVHTTASDGQLGPAEVVARAAAAGLAAVAIADHETIAGLGPALKAAADHPGLAVVPAIEINTDQPGSKFEVHVLGYFFDPQEEALTEFLAAQASSRIERAQEMLAKLKRLGYEIEWERVQRLAAGAIITRPHIAAALAERGYVRDLGEAMGSLLAMGGPAYVPRRKVTPAEAVAVIRGAGGAPVLAHPLTAGDDRLAAELADAGLMGLEVYHPLHSPADERRYRRLARRLDLLVTGGSDYHGPAFGGPPIGDIWVSGEVIKQMLDRLPAGQGEWSCARTSEMYLSTCAKKARTMPTCGSPIYSSNH